MHTLATGFRRAWRRSRIPIALAALLLAPGATAASLKWDVDVTPGNELFPVLDVTQAPHAAAGTAGGGNGLISVRVSGDMPGSVRLTVETDGLAAPTIVEAPLAESGTLELRPRLEWDRADLTTLHAPRAQTLRLTLQSPDGRIERRDVRVRLHPMDDALYYVREGREHVDLAWVFAAYVDPRDAVVDDVLAIARANGVEVDEPAPTVAGRLDQVHAVWDALEAHGLRYAEGNPALSRGPSIYSQRVRLLADSWESRRANCIDASVLIASVLERIGIRSLIVLVPGHAFVGFYTTSDDHSAEFVETTLLGDMRANAADRFDRARSVGSASWKRIASKLDGHHHPDYQVIDIARARSRGTLSIGTRGETPRARSGHEASLSRQHP